MYSAADHADLELAHDLMHWASELINGVLERSRIGTPMQALAFLSGAKADVDNADREATMAERYMQWKNGGAA
jgi:hypothetical protein